MDCSEEGVRKGSCRDSQKQSRKSCENTLDRAEHTLSWTTLPSSGKGSRSCTTQKVSQVIDKLPTSPGQVVSPQKTQIQLVTQWSLRRQAMVRYTVSPLDVAQSAAAGHHLQREPIIKNRATLEVWEQEAIPGKELQIALWQPQVRNGPGRRLQRVGGPNLNRL